MKLEQLSPLMIQMNQSPGNFGVILGSGISSGSGVLTGVGILHHFIEQIATTVGESAAPDPEHWFENRYSRQPTYSAVLEELAPSRPDRQTLLRKFFDGTPTEAHRAIARLVKSGHIGIIIEFNLDPLMERALDDENVDYQVVKNASDAAGVPSLRLVRECLVIKVNGDFRSLDMRHTTAELTLYDPPMLSLIRRVIDEFAYVVCGWSAVNDHTMRELMMKPLPHAPSWYWMAHNGHLSGEAEELLDSRPHSVISVSSADEAFDELATGVSYFANQGMPPLPTLDASMAKIERCLEDESASRVKVRKILSELCATSGKRLYNGSYSLQVHPTSTAVAQRVAAYGMDVAEFAKVAAFAMYWARDERTEDAVLSQLRALNGVVKRWPGIGVWLDLLPLPASVVYYSACTALVAAKKWGKLRDTFDLVLTNSRHKAEPAICALLVDDLLTQREGRMLPDLDTHFYPGSEWMWTQVRPTMELFVDSEEQQEKIFGRTQLLMALVYTELCDRWLPPVRYLYNTFMHGERFAEVLGTLDDRALLNAGFFGGDYARLQKAVVTLRSYEARRIG